MSNPSGVTGLLDSAIMHGDSLDVLKRMPADFFQCCVTSPPYWGLRDYGIEGQIGSEERLEDYVGRLVAIFSEVKRVLRPDGTLWLNIGDGYTSGGRKYRAPDRKTDGEARVRAMSYRPPTPDGLKPKDLIGIPWHVAFALQADGWYLRSDVIWDKPNCIPESVKDRPTKCHEYIFLLAKSQDYYYDHLLVREKKGRCFRNRRTVWPVNTKPLKEAHFATFPVELVLTCILAGSRKGDFVLDPFFGAGTVGVACRLMERRYAGIEINKEYVEMAVNRINEIKG